MENLNVVELKQDELQCLNGGDCECSSAVKAIGGAVAAVANYVDELHYKLTSIDWFGVL